MLPVFVCVFLTLSFLNLNIFFPSLSCRYTEGNEQSRLIPYLGKKKQRETKSGYCSYSFYSQYIHKVSCLVTSCTALPILALKSHLFKAMLSSRPWPILANKITWKTLQVSTQATVFMQPQMSFSDMSECTHLSYLSCHELFVPKIASYLNN